MDMNYLCVEKNSDGIEPCTSDDEGDSDLGDEPGVCVNDHYILANSQRAHAQDLSAFLE